MNPRRRLMLKSRLRREAEQALETHTLPQPAPPVEAAPGEINTPPAPAVEEEKGAPGQTVTKTKPTKKKRIVRKTTSKQTKKED